MPQCSCSKKDGRRCKSAAVSGETMCVTHLKMKERENASTLDDDKMSETSGTDFDVALPMPPGDESVVTGATMVTVDEGFMKRLAEEKDALHKENERLNIMVRALVEDMSKLQVAAFKKEGPSKAAIENKAKWLFYGKWKNDTKLVNEAQNRMVASGLVVITGRFKWQVLKAVCDFHFDSWEPEKKEVYYTEAKAALAARAAVRASNRMMGGGGGK